MQNSDSVSKKPGAARRIVGDVLLALVVAFTVYLSVIMTRRIGAVVLKDDYLGVFRYELILCAVFLLFALDVRFGIFTRLRFLPLRIVGWALRILVIAIVAAVLFFAAKITAGCFPRSDEDAKNVIVLGLALENGEPRPDLLSRLDTARQYLDRHPDATLLLTGGNPDDTGRTEAAVMRELLAEMGVPPEKTVLEDRARTTNENFKNILQYAAPDEPVVLITSDYHMDRAVLSAKRAGFSNILRRPAPSSFAELGANILSEIVLEVNDLTRKQEPKTALPAPAPAEKRGRQEIIEEMVVDYGSYGAAADARVEELLKELRSVDADAHARWARIMVLWKREDTDIALHYDVLPDGLDDTDALCIIVLGFQLKPDGSMRDELIERLSVAKRSAEKYPKALIVCTGGGTASGNPSATEAGKMAEWLMENGVAPERIVVEDRSLTTAQNALYTCAILAERYPQVRQLAIVSSDYHIATGELLFSAESILRAEKAGEESLQIVSNAAWKAPSGALSGSFQAGALLELSGDTETAFKIYYDTYDIHALPPLNK